MRTSSPPSASCDTEPVGVRARAERPEALRLVDCRDQRPAYQNGQIVAPTTRGATSCPDLPKANYTRVVEGYGLVVHPKVHRLAPQIVNSPRWRASAPRAAGLILSAGVLAFDGQDSVPKSDFPLPATCNVHQSEHQVPAAVPARVQDAGCFHCHSVGTKGRPAPLSPLLATSSPARMLDAAYPVRAGQQDRVRDHRAFGSSGCCRSSAIGRPDRCRGAGDQAAAARRAWTLNAVDPRGGMANPKAYSALEWPPTIRKIPTVPCICVR